MRRENAKDFLPLVQAFAEGKTLQFNDGHEWIDFGPGEILWRSSPDQYRIKPEPREIWVNEYPEGDSHTHYSAEAAAQGRGSCKAITRHYREVVE